MKRRNRSIVALLSLMMLVVVGALVAQGNRTLVQVNLTGTSNDPTLLVTPTRATICLTATATCPDQAQWRYVGRQLADNETIVISPKEGAPNCFTAGTFTLSRQLQEIDSGTATCPANSEWGYDVTLYRDGEAITVLDPMMVIDP